MTFLIIDLSLLSVSSHEFSFYVFFSRFRRSSMSMDDGPSSAKRPRLPGLKSTVKAETVKEEQESKPPQPPQDVIVESGPVQYAQAGQCGGRYD